jgi:lipopolysaccharide transport system permease protein
MQGNLSQLPVVVYSPESQIRRPGVLLRQMFLDLLAARELAWRLFVRNTSAQYRQSLIVTTFMFVFLTTQQILNIGKTDIPYPAYVMIGTLLWQVFVDSLNSPLRQIITSKSMLAKINFPREALVMAGLYEVIFNLAIRMILLLGVFFWFRITPPSSILLAPLGIVVLMILGTAIGVILSPLGALYDDIGRGLTIVTSLWFFLTPVVYPAPSRWPFSLLAWLNPVTPLIVTTRDWLASGSAANPLAFIVVSVIAFILLLIGWMLFRLAMPHLVERMSA